MLEPPKASCKCMKSIKTRDDVKSFLLPGSTRLAFVTALKYLTRRVKRFSQTLFFVTQVVGIVDPTLKKLFVLESILLVFRHSSHW